MPPHTLSPGHGHQRLCSLQGDAGFARGAEAGAEEEEDEGNTGGHPPSSVSFPTGHMEGGSSADTRRVLRPPRQHGQAPIPPERPEAPHAVLESKVKVLKEKRGAGRLGTPTAAPERPSPKKSRPRRGKPGGDADAAEPRAQLRTYLTDGMLDGGDPASPPAPRAGTPGLWRVPTPKGGACDTELPHGKSGGTRRSAPHHETPPLEEEAQTPSRDRRGACGSPPVTEGWERLSLAERVERNRRLLQEVLGIAVPGVYFGQGVAVWAESVGEGWKSFGVKGGPWCCPPPSAMLQAQLCAGSHPRVALYPHGCPVPPRVPCPPTDAAPLSLAAVGDACEQNGVLLDWDTSSAASPLQRPGEEFRC